MFEAVDVEIRFDYDSPEAEDIRRCLNTLYSTREGSQPLDRGLLTSRFPWHSRNTLLRWCGKRGCMSPGWM